MKFKKEVAPEKKEFANVTRNIFQEYIDEEESSVIDDEDLDDYEEDNPITEEQKAFANEFLDFLQQLIDNEESYILSEEFTSYKSLENHFKKHCLANDLTKQSTRNKIYYDFNKISTYGKYEQRIYNLFRQGVSLGKNSYDYIVNIFDIYEVNKKFHKIFKGNFNLFISGIFGLKNKYGIVNLGIHSFSSEVTTNYNKGNTIDICILSSNGKTITLYPVDAALVKKELMRIINKYSNVTLTKSVDSTKLLDEELTDELEQDLEDSKDKMVVDSTTIGNYLSFPKFIDELKTRDIKKIKTPALLEFMSTLQGKNKTGGSNGITRLQYFLNAYLQEFELVLKNKFMKFFGTNHFGLERNGIGDDKPDLVYETLNGPRDITYLEAKIYWDFSSYSNHLDTTNFHNADFVLAYFISENQWRITYKNDDYKILYTKDQIVKKCFWLANLILPSFETIKFTVNGQSISKLTDNEIPSEVEYTFYRH